MTKIYLHQTGVSSWIEIRAVGSDIIKGMKRPSKLITLLLIFLPLVLAGVIPLAPRSAAVRDANYKAAAYSNDQQWFSAAENWKIVLMVEEWRADASESLGRSEYALKHYEAAVSSFESAREVRELNFDNIILLGKSYLQLGRAGDAQDLWRQFSLKSPGDFKFLMEVASRQREIGDLFGTVSTLLDAYRLEPEDVQVNYLLGTHLAVIQPQSALKYLTAAEKTLAATHPGINDLISEISQTDLDTVYRTLRIGQILSGMEEWDLAAQAFNLVVRSVPENAYAWALLGEAKQHADGSGLEELEKALQLDSKSDVANALMALYYRRQNKPDLALPYLYKAVDANRKEAAWQIELGNTLADTGDLQSALKYLKSAAATAPESTLAWQSLAEFCFSHNLEVSFTGVEAARKALSLDPGNPRLQDLMGVGLMINGDLDSAERFISEAVKADPSNAGYHLHYGQVFLQKKDCTQAAIELRQAGNLAQDDRIRSNAERLLASYCPGY